MRLDTEATPEVKKARLHRKVATTILFESNGVLMAADVEAAGAFRVGQPRELFPLPQAIVGAFARSWTCSQDGQRIFLLVPPHTATHGGIEVVTDFGRLVKRK